MKIVTLNLNGLRSALQKGLAEWIAETDADIYAFQEIKIDEGLVPQYADAFAGYQWFAFPAQKKGYSGVAFLAKNTPLSVEYGCAHPDYDAEGRVLALRYDDFTALNVYLPSGTTGDERQAFKEAMMDYFYEYIRVLIEKEERLIIMGDFNICHKEIDIHNPVRLKNTSGFLPQERAWLTEFIALGMADSFRAVNAEAGQYTWWSYRAGARDKNLGWRIDYQFVSDALTEKIKSHDILSHIRLSDHCPTLLQLSI